MSAEEAVARLRGGFPETPLTARRIAKATESTGCLRRKALDAAAVDTTKLANLITGRTDRQSPFAITRQGAFERQVIGDNTGMSKVVALGREHLGVPPEYVGVVDLSEANLRTENAVVTPEIRALKTRHAFRRLLGGDDNGVELIRSPLLSLKVGERIAWLEPDVVALAAAGKIHVVAIRSFPLIDGNADFGLASQTIVEAAVQVMALRQLAVELRFDPAQVSDDVMIVLPDNVSLSPIAKVVSTNSAMKRLTRAIAAEAAILDEIPDSESLQPLPELPKKDADTATTEAAGREAHAAIARLPFRFRDSCSTCPMYRVCRSDAESQDLTVRLGTTVAETVGSIPTVGQAWDLITGVIAPETEGQAAVVNDMQSALRAVQRVQGIGA
jgi:hypothetical protein